MTIQDKAKQFNAEQVERWIDKTNQSIGGLVSRSINVPAMSKPAGWDLADRMTALIERAIELGIWERICKERGWGDGKDSNVDDFFA